MIIALSSLLPKSARSLQPVVVARASICLFNTHIKKQKQQQQQQQRRFYSSNKDKDNHQGNEHPQGNAGQKEEPDFEQYLDRGYSMITSQAYKSAIEDFSRAITMNSNDPRGYGSRADCYLETGQYQSAIFDYEQVIKLDPRSVPSLASIAYCHAKLGDKERALVLYDQVLALDPKYKAARGERADIRLQVGMTELAVQDYLYLLEEEPTNIKALLGVGKAAIVDKDFENAHTLYSKVVNLSISELSNRESFFTAKQNEHKKFVESKTEQFTEAWTGLGLTAAYRGKPEESIKAYSEAIALSPQLPHLYLQRANLYVATADFKKALMDVNKGLDLIEGVDGTDDMKLSLTFVKGTCLGQMEEFPEAVKFLSIYLEEKYKILNRLSIQGITQFLTTNNLRASYLLEWWVKVNAPLLAQLYQSTYGLHSYIENKGKEYSETILSDPSYYMSKKKGNKILKEAIDTCLKTIEIGKHNKDLKTVTDEGYIVLYRILNYIDPAPFLGVDPQK